jgi:hypothetical protein
MLPGTAQIVITSGVVLWCGGFFTDYNTTPTKVVLSCFGMLVGLWQNASGKLVRVDLSCCVGTNRQTEGREL